MNSVDERGSGSKAVVSGVGVLDKAVGILSFLAAEGPASLAGVVEGTGLARPTAYRLLSALEAHGLVARRGGRYALGLGLLGWGERAAAVASPGLVEAARPALMGLRDDVGESTQLYVREGDGRVCVASFERATGLRTTVAVGAVLPLDRGSAGKVLLAWAEDAGRFGVTYDVLAEVRGQGWAESVAEREEGVASVSAPVFRGGRVVAAVGASGPIARLGERPGERMANRVVEAAREVEAAFEAGRFSAREPGR
jgi:DNA-binding IclR family transcriptional regulator